MAYAKASTGLNYYIALNKKTNSSIFVRVAAFFDGENMRHAFKGVFNYDYPNYNPRLLAELIVNSEPNRILVSTNYYTGIHSAKENPKAHLLMTKWLNSIRLAGVNVFKRTCLYSTVYVYDKYGKLNRHRQAREKGVDLRLALDVIMGTILDEFDVAIVFSQDTDYYELTKDVNKLNSYTGKNVVIESAFPASELSTNIRGFQGAIPRPFDIKLFNKCLVG